jgi:hypothetical protein
VPVDGSSSPFDESTTNLTDINGINKQQLRGNREQDEVIIAVMANYMLLKGLDEFVYVLSSLYP